MTVSALIHEAELGHAEESGEVRTFEVMEGTFADGRAAEHLSWRVRLFADRHGKAVSRLYVSVVGGMVYCEAFYR